MASGRLPFRVYWPGCARSTPRGSRAVASLARYSCPGQFSHRFAARIRSIFQHCADLFQAPLQIGLRDNQRRRQPDDAFVRLPCTARRAAQKPRERTRRAVQSMPIHSPCAHLDDVRAVQLLHIIQRVLAERGRARRQVLIHNHAQRGARNGAGQRIAAEGAPWSPGPKTPAPRAELSTADTGLEAAGQRLTDDHNVRRDILVHAGEQLARAPQARLISSAISSTLFSRQIAGPRRR